MAPAPSLANETRHRDGIERLLDQALGELVIVDDQDHRLQRAHRDGKRARARQRRPKTLAQPIVRTCGRFRHHPLDLGQMLGMEEELGVARPGVVRCALTARNPDAHREAPAVEALRPEEDVVVEVALLAELEGRLHFVLAAEDDGAMRHTERRRR